MKFKFVKKGTEISSEQVGKLMNFEQVVDKAAGLGSAPLAKGGLATKSAFVSKALWLAAVPFTAAVYIGVVELSQEAEPPVPDEVVNEIIAAPEPEMISTADSLAAVDEIKDEEPKASPAQATAAAKPADQQEEEADKEEEAEEETADDILIKEDIMIKAEPVGGFPAFYETIDSELTYPEKSRISGLEGFVRVYFIVDKEGKAGNFRVVQSLGSEFDAEALRVMSQLTEWTPAQHNGQPVSSHLSIKLRFELEKE